MVAGLQFPKLISLEETINCQTEEARSVAIFNVSGLKVRARVNECLSEVCILMTDHALAD